MFRKDYMLKEIDKAMQVLEALAKLQRENNTGAALEAVHTFFSLENVKKYIAEKNDRLEIDKSITSLKDWQKLAEACSDIYEAKYKLTNDKNDLLFSIQLLQFLTTNDKTTFSITRSIKLSEREHVLEVKK